MSDPDTTAEEFARKYEAHGGKDGRLLRALLAAAYQEGVVAGIERMGEAYNAGLKQALQADPLDPTEGMER